MHYGITFPNMTEAANKALTAAILRLLRPLVRILLRNGVSYGAFSDLAKWVYVDVADKEFAIPGRKQSVSRVSVITGLSRKEVGRVQGIDTPDDSAVSQEYNRAARVIGGWVRDERFHDAEGNPADLPFEEDGQGPSFSELVKVHSGDVPARAILDELLRVAAVKRLGDGNIRLCCRAYVPAGGEINKLHILGNDVAFLIATIDHNLRQSADGPYFQRKVAYDNLPEEALPFLREMAGDKGQALLEALDAYLSTQDRDANPAVQGTGRKRAGVGIYYFEEDVPEA